MNEGSLGSAELNIGKRRQFGMRPIYKKKLYLGFFIQMISEGKERSVMHIHIKEMVEFK